MTPAPLESDERQVRTKKDRKLVAAIVALLLAGALGYGLMLEIRVALEEWGLEPEAAAWLATLVSERVAVPIEEVPGPMELEEVNQEYAYRATYIFGAAERLESAPDLEHAEQVEKGYFDRHLAAQERRLRAASLVDHTSRLLGDRTEEQSRVPLLGWRTVIDFKTTPACRWANGRNFRADQLPIIGVPGSVHPRCRCTAGPPIAGAPLIPSA